MTRQWLRLACRTGAIAIVVAAIVDPVLTRESRTRATIALQSDRASDDALVAAVRRTLSDRFDVIDGPFAAAAATVVVDPGQVRTDVASPGPIFAVADTASRITIVPLLLPRYASLDAAVEMRVMVAPPAGSPGPLALSLVADDVVVDSLTIPITADGTLIDTTLAYVPTQPGIVSLRVRAALVGTEHRAAYDAAVHVTDERSAVLFFDRRPSYQSTFVRRAVEADARFHVTHRVVTARDMSRGAGTPPLSLSDAAALEVFDVIVVGAPDALTDGDQRALDRFPRERGGSVVLLMDSLTTSAPLRTLTRVPAWRDVRGEFIAGTNTDSMLALPVSRMAIADPTPAGARTLAHAAVQGAVRATLVSPLWSSSVGAGQLIVSGLLDQWRYRGDPAVDFNGFWPAVIAEAASSVPAPIEPLNLPLLFEAGALVPISVWVPEPNGQPPRVMVVRDSGRVVDTLPVFADRVPERFHALWRVPTLPGAVEIVYAHGLATHRESARISYAIARDEVVRADRLDAWIERSGGMIVTPDDLEFLPGAIRRAIGAPLQPRPWYPMRSPWWIVPFALLLGAEWWMRRRDALT